MSELDFYKICYRIARGWPPTYTDDDNTELTYLRLNTFAVVDTEPEILTDQIAKDERWRGKGTFFSRPWYDTDEQDRSELRKMLPALLAWEDLEVESRSERPWSPSGCEFVPIRLGFFGRYVDKYDPGSFDESKGQQRTKEEVKRDLREMRDKFVAEAAKFGLYTLTFPSGGSLSDWFSKDHVLELKSAGDITAWKLEEPLSAHLSNEPVASPVSVTVTTDGLAVAYYLALLKIPRCEPDSISISYETPDDPGV